MRNIRRLFNEAKILNHANFSGMGFDGQQLIAFCTEAVACSLLMGLHLSDNGINADQSLMQDILDIFGMGVDDIPVRRRHDLGEGDLVHAPKRDEFDLRGKLKKYMRIDPPI